MKDKIALLASVLLLATITFILIQYKWTEEAPANEVNVYRDDMISENDRYRVATTTFGPYSYCIDLRTGKVVKCFKSILLCEDGEWTEIIDTQKKLDGEGYAFSATGSYQCNGTVSAK